MAGVFVTDQGYLNFNTWFISYVDSIFNNKSNDEILIIYNLLLNCAKLSHVSLFKFETDKLKKYEILDSSGNINVNTSNENDIFSISEAKEITGNNSDQINNNFNDIYNNIIKKIDLQEVQLIILKVQEVIYLLK